MWWTTNDGVVDTSSSLKATGTRRPRGTCGLEGYGLGVQYY